MEKTEQTWSSPFSAGGNGELVEGYLLRGDTRRAVRAGEAFLWFGSLGRVSLTNRGELTEEIVNNE